MAKAKGTTLIGAVRFLRKNKEKARKVLAPELHHYLEHTIVESSWYPEQDLADLIEAMLTLTPGSRDRVLGEMGAATAKSHLEGIYSHVVGRGNPSSVARSAFALWGSMHDTGRIHVEPLGQDEIQFTLVDFAMPSETLCGILTGYFAETYRIQGASEVTTRKLSCRARGDQACVWRLRYQRS